MNTVFCTYCILLHVRTFIDIIVIVIILLVKMYIVIGLFIICTLKVWNRHQPPACRWTCRSSERRRADPKARRRWRHRRSFVFRLLRAREREENGSQQINKEEEQWRHWIAKYQVRIPSCASLGLPSSVQLNYVLFTVSSHVGGIVVLAGKLSGSACSNCLWLSWVSSSTMQPTSVKAQQSNCQKRSDQRQRT